MRCAADAADADPQFPTAIDGQDREAVAGERRLRILTLLAGDDAGEETARLCRISGEVTRMTGAAIMLMSGPAQGVVVHDR